MHAIPPPPHRVPQSPLHLHHAVDFLDVRVLQPKGGQPEHPYVVLFTQSQTLDVVLHSLAQEAQSVGLQVGQRPLIQLQLSLHPDGVPARTNVSYPPQNPRLTLGLTESGETSTQILFRTNEPTSRIYSTSFTSSYF